MAGRKVNTQRRQRRRQQILDAALELFSSKGYEKTTMQEIVAEAGTSIGNCYFYFPNKDALLHALVERLTDQIREEAELATEGITSEAENLAVSIRILLRGLWQHAEIARLIFTGIAPISLRIATFGYYTAGLKRFFRENPQILGNRDLDLVSLAFQGSFALVFEKLLDAELRYDLNQLWAFIIRWNYAALGLDHTTIEDILRKHLP